jgi:peptidase M48-like protein
MAPPSHLPSLAEQGRLIGDLRALIAARGFVPFVAAPLLEPTPAHFPDRWRPDVLGVERLGRRLLGYVGLPELDVEVELYAAEAKVKKLDQYGNSAATTHKGAAAWFAGIVEGKCLFGAAADGLDAPDRLAGVMAHEVAHAYRHRHHLDLRDRNVEEPLTDLTTIYLGFGLLTTNASYRYRASGELLGAYTRTQSVG